MKTELITRPFTSDFDGFRKCILRQKEPRRVHCFEAYYDQGIENELLKRLNIDDSPGDNDFWGLQKTVNLHLALGNDIFFLHECSSRPCFPLDKSHNGTADSKSLDAVARGPIASWEDFEEYPWPDIAKLDTRPLEWLQKNLPENIKCSCPLDIGWFKLLIGYEALCYMIYDQPDLVDAVFKKLMSIFTDYAKLLGEFSCVGVVVAFDDMGNKTQLMYQPDFLMSHNIPIHRKCAAIAHQCGKLYVVHSCGKVAGIMNVLIDDVKIDAKHSFEDVIMPIEEAKRLYGDRTALVGGLDLDVLCRADEQTLRNRVRNILNTCSLDGGYAFGTGNSVAPYVPVDNFLIMMSEVWLFSERNFGSNV